MDSVGASEPRDGHGDNSASGPWCCAQVGKPQKKILFIALVDLGVTLIMVTVGTFQLVTSNVKEPNLVAMLCFVSSFCILVDIFLLGKQIARSIVMLWLLSHLSSYICWLFVIFTQVKNLDIAHENVPNVVHVTVQAFFSLMALLSLYGWFTWVLAVNWMRINGLDTSLQEST